MHCWVTPIQTRAKISCDKILDVPYVTICELTETGLRITGQKEFEWWALSVAPSTHSSVVFQHRQRHWVTEWHLLFWAGCLDKNYVSSWHETLMVLVHCRSSSWVITRFAHGGLFVGGITSLFSLFHLTLKDCPSALAGGTDPSLPWHSVQRQTTKLKCHFNFLQALVTAGLALSPGNSCKFHTVWCQKGCSPSISHSDLIHLFPLMCYSCG